MPDVPAPSGERLERLTEAVAWAATLHAGQRRKGTDIPYLSHLLAVTALVLEDGGDEDEAIAAVLHDALEDTGATYEEVRDRFGARVADIVRGCSDTEVTPKPPWRDRKADYLEHLAGAPPEVRRVALADKLHNARSLLVDLRSHGARATWSRFNAGADEQLWYFDALVAAFREPHGGRMADELADVIAELHRLVERDGRA